MSKFIFLKSLRELLTPLKRLIDKKAENVNWNENNPSSKGYIAGRTHYKEEKKVFHLNDNKITFERMSRNENIYASDYTFTLNGNIGDTFIIIWDGIEYQCKVGFLKDAYVLGNQSILSGMFGEGLPNTGEPFLWSFEPNEFGQFCTLDTTESHTVSCYSITTVTHKIPSEYLPEISSVGKEGTGEGAEIFNDYNQNEASGRYSHAEGYSTKAKGDYSHTEGRWTEATSMHSHAEGDHTIASGSNSHAEGHGSKATGQSSHAEGSSDALNYCSHAEGCATTARGMASHSEGDHTEAYEDYSHAEGEETIARSKYSHVQGSYNYNGSCFERKTNINNMSMEHKQEIIYVADSYTFNSTFGYFSFPSYKRVDQLPNNTTQYFMLNNDSYKIYKWTRISDYNSNSVYGNYELYEAVPVIDYLHIVGNGTSNTNRSNAHTLDREGLGWFAGGLKIGGNGQDDPSARDVILAPTVTSVGQTIVVKSTDANGKPTAWETIDPWVITSPNGTQFKITIDNEGTLSATELT